MAEALYGELSAEEKREFDGHLKSCTECASAFARYKSTLDAMDKRERPEPEDVFWTGYWDRLAGRLDEPERSPAGTRGWWKRFVPSLTVPPKWAYGAVAAVGLLLIGVFIGRIVFVPEAPVTPKRGPTVVTRTKKGSGVPVALENRTERYLERSKLLLLGLINFDPETEDPYTLNLPQQREISQNLVEEAGFLKTALDESADNRLLQLITDLEVILLQIANLESEQDLSAVELVKSGVDRRGVLLQINLEEMRKAAERSDRIEEAQDKNI
jgi:hypothetical protein